MPNRTIYVSDQDSPLFEEAKNIAGEALSSVIARALREYVSRHQEKQAGFKEISLKIGRPSSEREQRFIGKQIGKWSGFSNDKEWWLNANIYKTQKENWAVQLVTVSKATLLTDRKRWKESGDYLINSSHSELIVGSNLNELANKLPKDLYLNIVDLSEKEDGNVEFLDI